MCFDFVVLVICEENVIFMLNFLVFGFIFFFVVSECVVYKKFFCVGGFVLKL